MNLLEEAIIYSTMMHQGKKRKINHSPYILYPLEVAQILSTMTDDQEIIAAGVLHGFVEENGGTREEIQKHFGERVAALVALKTGRDIPGKEENLPWKEHRQYILDSLKNSRDRGMKMLLLADRLSNLRSLAAGYGEMGEKVWEELDQPDQDLQLWYYKSVAEAVEMDLNKTGVYKEYIDRINYIWPGTFEPWKARYRKYREVSVEGCRRVGRGAKSDVYRYNDELIVKVYNEKNTYKDVEREISLTRTAFVMGLPTAISFGIVSVGNGYGALYELIKAKTISEYIAGNPKRVDYYAGVMAELAHQIHSTKPRDTELFADAGELFEAWVDRAMVHEDEILAQTLRRMVKGIPPQQTLVHGDFHTGNVFLVNGEPLFIDADRMSVGNPLLDLSSLYLFYVGYADFLPGSLEEFMGFSARTAKAFYDSFIRQYLGSEEEAEIERMNQKAALLSHVRLIGQIKKRHVLSDEDLGRISQLIDRIRELTGILDNLE